MGSASSDNPGALLSSEGRQRTRRRPSGRVTTPLRAGGSAIVNSGCTRPEAALPRPTGRRPRRVAPNQSAGERLGYALARRVSALGLEHRAKLLAQLGCVLVAMRRGGVLSGGRNHVVLRPDDGQLAVAVALKTTAIGHDTVQSSPFPGYRAIQHPSNPRVKCMPPWTIHTPVRLLRNRTVRNVPGRRGARPNRYRRVHLLRLSPAATSG